MEKYIFILCFVFGCSYAQIGINTTNPSITLAIEDNGLGINRTATNELTIVSNDLPRIKISADGKIGINEQNPSVIFDVNANNDYIKIQNLPFPSGPSGQSEYLAIDSDGFVGRRASFQVFGQVMRIGAFQQDYFTNNGEQDLVLNTMQTQAPNQSDNIITDIPNASITGNSIVLGEGTYHINLKLVGVFHQSNENNRVQIKLLINDNEHSLLPAVFYGAGFGSARKTGYFTDYLIVPSGATYTLRFRIEPFNNHVTIFNSFNPIAGDPSSGYSMRTLITILRIKN